MLPGMCKGALDTTVDLRVKLGLLELANPVMTASGTCGYGLEYAPYMDLSRLGAFVTKSVTCEERKGNAPARTNLDRYLVGRPSNPPGFHLQDRLCVGERLFEKLERILLGLGLDRIQ